MLLCTVSLNVSQNTIILSIPILSIVRHNFIMHSAIVLNVNQNIINLSVTMLSIIMHNFIMHSAIVLNVNQNTINLSVTMLSVFIQRFTRLSVLSLSVVHPDLQIWTVLMTDQEDSYDWLLNRWKTLKYFFSSTSYWLVGFKTPNDNWYGF